MVPDFKKLHLDKKICVLIHSDLKFMSDYVHSLLCCTLKMEINSWGLKINYNTRKKTSSNFSALMKHLGFVKRMKTSRYIK